MTEALWLVSLVIRMLTTARQGLLAPPPLPNKSSKKEWSLEESLESHKNACVFRVLGGLC